MFIIINLWYIYIYVYIYTYIYIYGGLPHSMHMTTWLFSFHENPGGAMVRPTIWTGLPPGESDWQHRPERFDRIICTSAIDVHLRRIKSNSMCINMHMYNIYIYTNSIKQCVCVCTVYYTYIYNHTYILCMFVLMCWVVTFPATPCDPDLWDGGAMHKGALHKIHDLRDSGDFPRLRIPSGNYGCNIFSEK